MNLLRSIVVDFISTNLTKICCCWFKPVHYITHCLSSWEFHSPMTLQPYFLASYQIRILPFFKFERKRRFALEGNVYSVSDCRSRTSEVVLIFSFLPALTLDEDSALLAAGKSAVMYLSRWRCVHVLRLFLLLKNRRGFLCLFEFLALTPFQYFNDAIQTMRL